MQLSGTVLPQLLELPALTVFAKNINLALPARQDWLIVPFTTFTWHIFQPKQSGVWLVHD